MPWLLAGERFSQTEVHYMTLSLPFYPLPLLDSQSEHQISRWVLWIVYPLSKEHPCLFKNHFDARLYDHRPLTASAREECSRWRGVPLYATE